MKTKAYVISLRGLYSIPSQGCAIELENVLVKVSQATLFIPRSAADLQHFCREKAGENAHIFLVAIYFGQLSEVLRKMTGWRKVFAGAYAYVFDAFLNAREENKGWLKKKLSAHSRNISDLDGLFIPIRPEVDRLSQSFQIRVEYLPMAADVQQFGSDQTTRGIDVNAYGRQNIDHLTRLSDLYNHRESSRSVHFTNHALFSRITNFQQHRAHFWKLLSMSRIALAYDPLRVDPLHRVFPHSFVAQRWFESLAAGCVVVGYKPNCPETAELLNWQDATVECPENVDDFVMSIEKILDDPDFVARTRSRNVYNMLLKHDWSYRVEEMMVKVGLPQLLVPEMAKRRASLLARAEAIMPTLPG